MIKLKIGMLSVLQFHAMFFIFRQKFQILDFKSKNYSESEPVAPVPAASVPADDKEDEYKRKLEEKKREHQRRRQEAEQAELDRQQAVEQAEQDKKKQREAELDAKFEV